jgi:hypothetical protein
MGEVRGFLAGVVMDLLLGGRVGLAQIGSNWREIGRGAGCFIFSLFLIFLRCRFRGGHFFAGARGTGGAVARRRRCLGLRGLAVRFLEL